LVVLLAGAGAVYVWKNPERSSLDNAARAGVPGRFVTLSRGVTHYDVAGPDTGRTVLLVHGFSVPYYIWDSTFVALSQSGYRVIRYDLFGRGWSDRPDASYDGALYDAQIDELLDSLRVTQPVDLVGLSFGGFVTAHYVAGHAQRVRTLTLVDPMSEGVQVPNFMQAPVLGSWVWQVTVVPGMAEGQASDFLYPERFPDWASQYRPQMQFRGFGRSLLRSAVMSKAVGFDTLYANVARTGIPVLLVWGKQDQTVPFAMSSVVRTSIPAVEFFPVDSAGHLPHIEQTALVNARLFSFWASHPASR
jgi:pimeloyl-ACP methyl ester carboxylesterase